MRALHDRQPVRLTAAEVDVWLNTTSSRDELLRLTAPRRDNVPLAIRQVSTDVNNVRNDHPELLTKPRFTQPRSAESSDGVAGQRASPRSCQLRLRLQP